jgi:hypothetical protein
MPRVTLSDTGIVCPECRNGPDMAWNSCGVCGSSRRRFPMPAFEGAHRGTRFTDAL